MLFGVFFVEISAEVWYNDFEENFGGVVFMTMVKSIYYKAAAALAAFLGVVLFVCANTASCGMIHQPKAPDGLKAFSKIEQ